MSLVLLAAPHCWAQAPAWQGVHTLLDHKGSANISATATDAQGNVYLAGVFENKEQLGSTPLVSNGGFDVFVAKWSVASQRIVWAVSAGSERNDDISYITLQGGNVYVAGTFAGPATGFGPPQTGQGSTNIFVTKLMDGGSRAAVA